MLIGTLEDFLEITEFFRTVFFAGPVEVFDERLHAVEAGFVERLKDVERGEQKGPGAARGVEDGDVLNRVPKGPEQFRAFTVFNHVLGELADIQVVSDKVIDGKRR